MMDSERMDAKIMRLASYLLPDPGGEVVRGLLDKLDAADSVIKEAQAEIDLLNLKVRALEQREAVPAVAYISQSAAMLLREAHEMDEQQNVTAWAKPRQLDAIPVYLATPPRDVPDGWVLVPRVPTAAMLDAMDNDSTEDHYTAMLAAAPSGEGS